MSSILQAERTVELFFVSLFAYILQSLRIGSAFMLFEVSYDMATKHVTDAVLKID